MANRKWMAHWSQGYAGTDSQEEIDLIDDLGYSEEEVEAMSDDEASNEVSRYAWDQAVETVEGWAEPA